MSGVSGISGDMLSYAMGASTQKTGGDLAMDDFLSLIVAQMTNQNMMQPMDDTQFIAQMAQISQLQATQDMLEYSLTSYATSFIGKEVLAIKVDETGKEIMEKGVVSEVQFFNGSPELIVNGQTFGVGNIMSASAPAEKAENENPEAEQEDASNPQQDETTKV